MRLLYPAFLVTCMLLAVVMCMWQWVGLPPEQSALGFLELVKSGNVAVAAELFGDNSCRCPPKGGYASLLKYESGEEPNLAFLSGRAFETGKATVTWLKDSTAYVFPWDKPESVYVDVALWFDKSRYSPYFLPLPMAYGRTMSFDKLRHALENLSEDDWKGFSLRLRPALTPGVVPPAPRPSAREKQSEEEQEADKGLVQELLGPEAALYMVPKDAGEVILPNGQKVAAEKVEAMLPRLQAVRLRLNMQRRGVFKPWRVAKFKFMDAVVKIKDQEPVTLLAPLSSNARKASITP